MRILSKEALHLIGYTLVIGGSFYLGILIFPYVPAVNEISSISTRELSPLIEQGVKNDITIQAGNAKTVLKSDEMKKWVQNYTRDYTGKKDKRLSYALISSYVESIAPIFNIEPVNAQLRFHDNKADVFVPSIQGRKIYIDDSAVIIAEAILSNKSSISLAYEATDPEITLDKINDLGIKTLIGKGESDYGKSSASRINNIKIGLAKFNGVILKPGEQFSFNNILGEVDDKGGYQAELVIKGGQLVKEFGGGLCQVATTVFRSAIMAGLDIKERKPHSFPVHYYNPQGFDATIYPGVVDLKFVNNTSNHVLIQSKLTGSKLVVEVYGSDDGRKVSIEGPFQYDQKPNGAMKAYFTRVVTYADQTEKRERFDSNYNPPPASPLERNPLE